MQQKKPSSQRPVVNMLKISRILKDRVKKIAKTLDLEIRSGIKK